MLRILFALIIIIHASIHLLGFVKEWGMAQVEQLSGQTLLSLTGAWPKAVGILWLIACLILLTAAAGYLAKKEWWWMAATGGMLLSQLLIILYWPDAKAGTVANVIILAAVVLAYGSWRFDEQVAGEVETLLAEMDAPPTSKMTDEMLTDLPVAVQHWLRASGAVGQPLIRTAHFRQRGKLRTKPGSNWMPVEAQQYVRVYPPGFIWQAEIDAGLLHIAGRDKYQNGRGHMLIKMLSLLPVADASGEQTDQGTLLRYLGEIVWYPTAAISDYITWDPVNSSTAKATMTHGGVSASGLFRFNAKGEVVSFQAERYYDRGGEFTLETWFIRTGQSREFEGIRVPASAAVTWKLDEGDFTWYRLEISDVEYNRSFHENQDR